MAMMKKLIWKLITQKKKNIDESILTEYEDSPGQYLTSNWDDQCLEITCSNIWGLSLRFSHVIDNYL